MPDAWVGAPSQFTTDAPRTSTAPVRTRRGAFEERGAPVPAPRATLRAREGAMLTPRDAPPIRWDAPPIRWDAPPIPEDALRVRRASARGLGDALTGADRAAAEPRACRPILRASRRPRSRPVGTPRGALRARSGAVRVRSECTRSAASGRQADKLAVEGLTFDTGDRSCAPRPSPSRWSQSGAARRTSRLSSVSEPHVEKSRRPKGGTR